MRKRVVALLSCVMLTFGLVGVFTGCGKTAEKKETSVSYELEERSVDENAKKELLEATAKLKASSKYVINNQLTAPDGNAQYIEVVKDGDSYTEYPVTATGESAESSTNYQLNDWLDLDGDAFILVGDTTDGKWYKYPEGYGTFLQSRNVMYADIIIPSLVSLKKLDKTDEADIGDGTEEFTLYDGVIPASKASEILGASTSKVYESMITKFENEDKYKDEVHLAKLYMQDLAKTLTVSDTDVEFAVDKNGVLRELNFTCGGIGTKLKYFKGVSLKTELEDLEKPAEIDDDNCTSIIETMTELAEFAKDYNTYNDFLNAYGEKYDAEAASQSAVTAEEESTDEDKKESTDEDKESSNSKKKSSSK